MPTLDYQKSEKPRESGASAFWVMFVIGAVVGSLLAMMLDDPIRMMFIGRHADGGAGMMSALLGTGIGFVIAGFGRELRAWGYGRRRTWAFLCGVMPPPAILTLGYLALR